MVPRENLEESVVRTGRDFPAGGNPCHYSRVEVAADARHRV